MAIGRLAVVRVDMLAALAVMALALCPDSQSQEAGSVEATFAMEDRSLTVGEPVRVRFVVVNQTTVPIALALGIDSRENFAFRLRRPDGGESTLPPWPRREGLHGTGNFSVKPGERYQQYPLLNEWTTFRAAGEYVLEVKLNTPIQTPRGAVDVPPSRLAFEIAERDEYALLETCERLTRQIEQLWSVRELQEAATALAQINEPLAVPYLERALASRKYVESIVTRALAQIGDANAVRVLAAVANESPQWPPDADTLTGWRAFLASRALGEIARKTTDKALREEALRATRNGQ